MAEYIELEKMLREWTMQVMRFSMKRFVEYAVGIDLSMPQIATLIRLNGEWRCGVTKLGEELGVSGPAASQMVEKLVQMGLIEREEDAHDRRIRRLVLTKKGKSIAERGVGAREEWIKGFCSTLPPELAQTATYTFKGLVEAARRFEAGQTSQSGKGACV